MRRLQLLFLFLLSSASLHCAPDFDEDFEEDPSSLAQQTNPTRCPHAGRITYTLERAAQPNAAQRDAYAKITTAMNEAVRYYNCHTNITKALRVSYVPSVATADGNINGSIRFGAPSTFEYTRALHEISHTVGIGTAQRWQSLLSKGVFTGSNATRELRAITGKPNDVLKGDAQHFWPYGLNYASEVKSVDDVIGHCRMVMAIRKDLGL